MRRLSPQWHYDAEAVGAVHPINRAILDISHNPLAKTADWFRALIGEPSAYQLHLFSRGLQAATIIPMAVFSCHQCWLGYDPRGSRSLHISLPELRVPSRRGHFIFSFPAEQSDGVLKHCAINAERQ